MRYYHNAGGKLEASASLWEALGLSCQRHRVISLVGGGGKTSLMYQLAKEAANQGKRVIITTSTHIYYPKDYQVLETTCASDAGNIIWEGNMLVVGVKSGDEKLKGLAAVEIGRLREYADIVLVEADGAKHLPLKIPGNHEPVIIGETEAVIACAGLDCLGKRFVDVCFRYELAEPWLLVKPDMAVNPGHVAELLCSSQGGRKGVGDRVFRTVLNKADTALEPYIRELVSAIAAQGVWVAVTSFKP